MQQKAAAKSTKKTAKLKATSTPKSPKPISPSDLTPADYNPREMSDEARKGLQVSMREFEDISGITWNKTTNNIVTGHHRWQNLIEAYGLDALEFKEISPSRFLIVTKDGIDTTFVLRVVEWDAQKEKAANVAANSPTLAGTFTAELGDILAELQGGLDGGLFEDLRCNELTVTDGAFNGSLPGNDWNSNIAEVDKVEANLDGIITTIRVDCPQELRSEIFGLLQKTLTDSKFADKAKIK